MKKLLISLILLISATTINAQTSQGDNEYYTSKSILTIELAPSFTRTGNSYGSTASTNIPTAGVCDESSIKDIWFKFVVEAGKQNLFIEMHNITTGKIMTDGVMAIYNRNGNNLNFIACDDNSSQYTNMPKIFAPNLTVGDTIFVRIWSKGTTAQGAFKISIYEMPQENDECNGAINIDVKNYCDYKSYNFIRSSPSIGSPTPSCNYTSSFRDIWFKFTAPQSGRVRIATEDPNYDPSGFMTNQDIGCAVYESTNNNCQVLKYLECQDGLSYTQWTPTINMDSLIPNKTYYLRFWDQVDRDSNFNLCIYEPLLPSPNNNSALATDNPEDAPLIISSESYYGSVSSMYSTNHPSTAILTDNIFCGTIQNNSWLKFVANSDSAYFEINVMNCKSGNSESIGGIQMQIYEITDFNNGYIAKSNCFSPGSPVDGFIFAKNLVIGNTYYLMIDGLDNDLCDYIITSNNISNNTPSNITITHNEPLFKISPNPNNGTFSIDLKGNNDPSTSISVKRTTGELVYHENIGNKESININLERYGAALYIVEIKSKDSQFYTKVLVTK